MAAKVTMRKVRIVKPLEGVFAEYQPEVGQVYNACFCERGVKKARTCAVKVRDKMICLRDGEYEFAED